MHDTVPPAALPCTLHAGRDGPPLAGEGLRLPALASCWVRAADWRHRFLQATIRLEGPTCALLRLRFQPRQGADRFEVVITLMPDLSARLCLDLGLLDGSAVLLRRLPGLLKGSASGRRLAPEDVACLEIVLDTPGGGLGAML